jgi:protein-S-isoprenylcysteine O-methyltransferase Ste14
MSQPKETNTDGVAILRGDYTPTALSTKLLFSVGRAITGPAQYFLITSWQPLQKIFNIAPPAVGSAPTTLTLSLPGMAAYTFPRLPFLTASMPAVLSAKHLLWIHLMMRERMTPKFATFAILSDFIYEAVSSTVFTASSVNPLWSERYFNIGITIFYASAAIELLAELQRIAFKRNPKNAGKPCTTGFWAITRHINYTMNVAYGFGYGLACGGPIYSLLTAGMYLANFTTNAMPGIEKYCRERYGEQWVKYERDVPWQLIPFVY